MASDRLVSLATTVYIHEPAKVLYVKASKSACTTMLWALLEMGAYDPSDLLASSQPRIMRSQLVHDAARYPVPTIDQVGTQLREEALTSAEWMRLAVVRDPYERLYSAWESRILLRAPGPWLELAQPGLVTDGDRLDVAASFRTFVAAMAQDRGAWQADPHFAQQVHLLALDEIDYTDLVPTAKLGELFEQLSQRSGRTVAPGRSNEGLGFKASEVFDASTALLAEDLYAEDFNRLGFARRTTWAPSSVILEGPSRKALEMVHARNERLLELALDLQVARGERAPL